MANGENAKIIKFGVLTENADGNLLAEDFHVDCDQANGNEMALLMAIRDRINAEIEGLKHNELEPLLCEQIAEELFNQSCVYSGDLKSLGWAHKYTQSRQESSNCRFHVEQVIEAARSLGYELKRKDLSA